MDELDKGQRWRLAQLRAQGLPRPNCRAVFQALVGAVMRVPQALQAHFLVSGRSNTISMAPPHIGQEGTTSHGGGGLVCMRRTIPKHGRGYEGSSIGRPARRATSHALGGTVTLVWQSTHTNTWVVGRSYTSSIPRHSGQIGIGLPAGGG